MDMIKEYPHIPAVSRWWLLLLLLLIAASYSNTLHSPFVLDDYHSFIDNPNVYIYDLSRESLAKLSETVFGIARLVPVASFALDHSLGSGTPFLFHVTNILVHLLCTVAVFFFTRVLLQTKRGARLTSCFSATGFSLIAAGLWALNPVQTNAVTYLVQRMTSMAALFYVSALLLYVHARLTPATGRRLLFFLGAAIAAALAFMSKEIAFTLPLAVLLVEWYFLAPDLSGRTSDMVRRKPWLGVLAVFVIVVLVMQLIPLLERFVTGYGHRDFTLTERVMTEWRVVVFYISLLLFPLPGRLNLDHDFPLSTSLVSPPTTLISLVLLLALFGLAVKTRHPHPLVSFGLVWFFLNLFIESTIIPLEIIFEHRLYLPSVGFFIGIAAIIDSAAAANHRRFPARFTPSISRSLVLMLVLLCAFFTFSRNADWRDEVTFYTDMVEKSPRKARPRTDLGVAYAEQDDFEKAQAQYRIAMDLDPEYATTYTTMGNLYRKMGFPDKAIEYYRQSLQLEPGIDATYNSLGLAFLKKGLADQALQAFEKSLEIKPGDPGVHLNIGETYEKKGLFPRAAAEYRQAMQLRPDYAEPYNKLGILYGKKGLAGKALEQLRIALSLDPDNPGYHFNIANAYMMKGMVRKAEEHRRKARIYQNRQ